MVRTTIRVDEALYREVKARAAREGRTVASVIEDAIRRDLAASQRRTEALEPLPVHGGSGTLPGVSLTDREALTDVMDQDLTSDALR